MQNPNTTETDRVEAHATALMNATEHLLSSHEAVEMVEYSRQS